jgi:hypothetical protein
MGSAEEMIFEGVGEGTIIKAILEAFDKPIGLLEKAQEELINELCGRKHGRNEDTGFKRETAEQFKGEAEALISDADRELRNALIDKSPKPSDLHKPRSKGSQLHIMEGWTTKREKGDPH